MQILELITFISLVLGIIGGACGIIFGVKSNRRNNKSDDAEEGQKYGKMLTDIEYIKSGVDEIKHKQESQDRQYIDVVSRITVVEESTKQAHHRINGLEEIIKH